MKEARSNFLIIACFMIAISCSSENSSEHHNHTPHVGESKVTDLMLTASQIQLANIQTQTIQLKPMNEPRVITARIVQNSDMSQVISSRVTGRIERLFNKETGRLIKKGEPLYEIYSESLLTLQQEFIVAHNQVVDLGGENLRYKSFEDAAHKKLRLYGLAESQINELAATGKAQPRITFLAPASGTIKLIEVQEGQLVIEGSTLYRIENLKALWVEAELFADEVNLVKPGDKVKVDVNQFPVIETDVEFINPEFKNGTQTWIMRASVLNSVNLKPGMTAQVWIDQPKNETLTVPVQAVIRSQAGAHVYVETDKNTFRPRKVKTGLENFSEVEILEGLKAGETVATSGAYLIYSEYILKQGINPTEHQH
jgi:membrane fusion protein, copper/silver efflux system